MCVTEIEYKIKHSLNKLYYTPCLLTVQMTVLFNKLPCTELYLESMIPWKYAPKNIIIDRSSLSNKIIKNYIAKLLV